jgi:DNA mismatch repair protein MutS2
MDARAVPVAASGETVASLLLQARHPLVANCVANDIALGDQFDILLITGPNTGGKTVVLKTLGLLILMACCGLHIPVAEGSHVAIPGEVFADIGDEQSIEQSLSTFSSHIKNIIHILSTAKAGDLVLLDEVGAGTDPDEGAALAKAVLRALQRRGAQVIATTHYGELKQFALSARRFENASVEFDIATLAPTYHLRIGIPGASNALDIANRLGMPAELVMRARRYLGRERAETEEATQRLEETQRQLMAHTRSAERERDEIEVLRRDYENRLASVQRDADLKIAIAQRDARELLRTTRQEADSILRDLRSAPRESKQTEEARDRLRALTSHVGRLGRGDGVAEGVVDPTEVSSLASPTAHQIVRTETPERAGSTSMRSKKMAAPLAHRPLRSRRDNAGPPETIDFQPRIGDLVHVKTIDREGELLHIGSGGERVEVRVGAIRLQLPRTQIAAPRNTDRTVGGVSAIRVRKAFTVPDEINLIGLNTDEAMPLVEKYLDDAILAEVEQIRIVHGRGSGILRKAIHAWLKSHPDITDFATAPSDQGGDGATIVKL